MVSPTPPAQSSRFCLKTSISHLLAYLRLLPRFDGSPNGASSSSDTSNAPRPLGPPIPEVDQWFPTDPEELCELLVELVLQLRPLLPGDCNWLEDGAIEILSECPVAAGEFTNILIGRMGNRKVAIKHYRIYSSSDYFTTYTRFFNAALAYGRFTDDSFVPFVGIYSTPKHPMCLVFEHMDNYNLRQYLHSNEHLGRCELLLETARAVDFLHSRDVVHKNLKITNVLVDCKGHARLAGFGSASLPSAPPGMDIDRSFHGAAPELIEHQYGGMTESGATKFTDVFAFGVLAWEVFAGRVPFSDRPKVAGVVSMWKGHRPDRPHHPELSDRLWKTIEGCWKVNPAQRMTIAQVVGVLEAEVKIHQSRSLALRQDQA